MNERDRAYWMERLERCIAEIEFIERCLERARERRRSFEFVLEKDSECTRRDPK